MDVATRRPMPRFRRSDDEPSRAGGSVDHALAAPTWLVDKVTIPATVGALWMVGYLLVVGIRAAPEGAADVDAAAPVEERRLQMSRRRSSRSRSRPTRVQTSFEITPRPG